MCLFLLPLKINESVKKNFLRFAQKKGKVPGLTRFSCAYECPGGEWDTLLKNWIKENRAVCKSSTETLIALHVSRLRSGPLPRPERDQERAARELISIVEKKHNLRFLDNTFPLFGFMREVATDAKKNPKLYLWRGIVDAIAYSTELKKYVIVDFKAVYSLLDYWQKRTDLCGKHLHQCLVYAKLLQLHMGLDYLPPILVAAIDGFTGMDGYFPLFKDYPKECYKKLDEYEWFVNPPQKRPLKIYKPEKLLSPEFIYGFTAISPNTSLKTLFNADATVENLLDLLGYDSIEIVPSENSNTNDILLVPYLWS